MQRLTVFNHATLDGFFTDRNGDMGWAHRHDAEWTEFAAQNAGGGGTLLFGRKTYEQMASWWPTDAAKQAMPAVAERMNALPKVVFSRTLQDAAWSNTTLVSTDLVAAVRALKHEEGRGLAVIGSGSIVSQVVQAGLVDQLDVVVNPLVLGQGRSMFAGVETPIALKLVKTRAFGNGNVVLTYGPAEP